MLFIGIASPEIELVNVLFVNFVHPASPAVLVCTMSEAVTYVTPGVAAMAEVDSPSADAATTATPIADAAIR